MHFSAMSLDKFEKSPREIFHPEIQKVDVTSFFDCFYLLFSGKIKSLSINATSLFLSVAG